MALLVCLLLWTTVSAFSLVVPVSAVTAVSRVLCFMTNKLIDSMVDLQLLVSLIRTDSHTCMTVSTVCASNDNIVFVGVFLLC